MVNPYNAPLTMTLTVHEWRILAACTKGGKKHLNSEADRRTAARLAAMIAEQTGKFPSSE